MFENVIACVPIVTRLSGEIASDSLPQAVLFSGTRFSGKRTAAFETARARSCLGDAKWNCPCQSCARHRSLTHGDFLMTGPLSRYREWTAIASLLSGRGTDGAPASLRTAYVRAIRSLLLRFTPALFEGEEAKLSKASPLVRELEEFLSDFPAIPAESLETAFEKSHPAASKLAALVPDTIPLFQIRNAEKWARLTPFGRRKFLVVENADRMLEGSRNALLKILEEPPENTSFILLSTRRNAMGQTLLSRLRTYSFPDRSAPQEREIMSRVFKTDADDSVASFFERNASPSNELLRARARDFLSAIVVAECGVPADGDPLHALAASGEGPAVPEAVQALLQATADFGSKNDSFDGCFARFLDILCDEVSVLNRASGGDERTFRIGARWNDSITQANESCLVYNQNPSLALERLSFEMRAALRGQTP